MYLVKSSLSLFPREIYTRKKKPSLLFIHVFYRIQTKKYTLDFLSLFFSHFSVICFSIAVTREFVTRVGQIRVNSLTLRKVRYRGRLLLLYWVRYSISFFFSLLSHWQSFTLLLLVFFSSRRLPFFFFDYLRALDLSWPLTRMFFTIDIYFFFTRLRVCDLFQSC